MKTAVAFVKKYTPFVNRPGLAGRSAVEQMVHDIRDLAANAGGVTADDLINLGWPRAAVDRHGTAARERAATLSAA